MAAEESLLKLKVQSTREVESYLKSVADSLDHISAAVKKTSLKNMISKQDAQQALNQLAQIQREITAIQKRHTDQISRNVKQTAVGMRDGLTIGVNTKAVQEAQAQLKLLKNDLDRLKGTQAAVQVSGLEQISDESASARAELVDLQSSYDDLVAKINTAAPFEGTISAVEALSENVLDYGQNVADANKQAADSLADLQQEYAQLQQRLIAAGKGQEARNVISNLEDVTQSYSDAVDTLSDSTIVDETAKAADELSRISGDYQTVAEALNTSASGVAATVTATKDLAQVSQEYTEIAEKLNQTQAVTDAATTAKQLQEVADGYAEIAEQSSAAAGDLSTADTVEKTADAFGDVSGEVDDFSASLEQASEYAGQISEDAAQTQQEWANIASQAAASLGGAEGLDPQKLDNIAGAVEDAQEGMSDFASESSAAAEEWQQISDDINGLEMPLEGEDFSKMADDSAEIAENLGDAADAAQALQITAEQISQAWWDISRVIDTAKQNTFMMADSWQRSVIDLFEIRDSTEQINRNTLTLLKGQLGATQNQLTQAAETADQYWKNIWRQANAVARVNRLIGKEIFKPSGMDSKMLQSMRLSQRLMAEQTDIVGKMKVLRVMAEEDTAKNVEAVHKLQAEWDDLEKRRKEAVKGRTYISDSESAAIEQRKAAITLEQQEISGRRTWLQYASKGLDVFTQVADVAGQISDTLRGTNTYAEKREVLESQIAFVQEVQLSKQQGLRTAAGELADKMEEVELRSRSVGQYWYDTEVAMSGAAQKMQEVLQAGMMGTLSRTAVLKSAEGLLKRQDTWEGRFKVMQFISQQRLDNQGQLIEDLQGQWNQLDRVVNDYQRGYINLTKEEQANIAMRQSTLSRQLKIAGVYEKVLDKASMITQAGSVITGVVSGVKNIFGKSQEQIAESVQLQKELITLQEQSDRMREDSTYRSNSVAGMIAGMYLKQETSVTASKDTMEQMLEVLQSMESTIERMFSTWTTSTKFIMESMGATAETLGSIDEAAGLGNLATQAQGLERIVDTLISRKTDILSVFSPSLIQRWSESVGASYTDLASLVADPKLYDLYQNDVLGMLGRSIQHVTGLSSEMAQELATSWLPTLTEVNEAAEQGQALAERGFVFQQQATSKAKTQLTRAVTGAARTTGFKPMIEGMDTDQLASNILREAPRLGEMFDEEFIGAIKERFPAIANQELKGLDDFLRPEVWNADVRHSFVVAMSEQLAAINGKAMEFNYFLANTMLPTMEDVRKAAEENKAVTMEGMRIDQLSAANPAEAKAQLIDSILRAEEGQASGYNVELFSTKGLGYNLDQVLSEVQPTFLNKALSRVKQWKQANIPDEASIRGVANELEKALSEVVDRQQIAVAEQNSQEIVDQLNQEAENLRSRLERVKQAMTGTLDAETLNSVMRVENIAQKTEVGLLSRLRGFGLGVADVVLSAANAIEDVKVATGIGKEMEEIAATQKAILETERDMGGTAAERYKLIQDLGAALQENRDIVTGTYQTEALQEYVTAVQMLPDANQQLLQDTGQIITAAGSITNIMMEGAKDAREQYEMLFAAMQKATGDPTKFQELKGLADQAFDTMKQNEAYAWTWGNDFVDSVRKSSSFLTNFGDTFSTQMRDLVGIFNQSGVINVDTSSLEEFSNVSEQLDMTLGGLVPTLSQFGMSGEKIAKIVGLVQKAFGVLSIALVGAQVGLQVFDTLMGRSPAQIEKAATTLEGFYEKMQEGVDLLTNASEGAVEEQIMQMQLQQVQQQAAADAYRETSTTMTDSFSQIRTGVQAWLTGEQIIYGTLGEKFHEFAKEADATQQAMDDLMVLKPFIDQMARFRRVTEEATEAYKSIIDIQQQMHASTLKYYEDIEREQAQMYRDQLRKAEGESMDRLFAEEDWALERLLAYKEHMTAISDLEKEMFDTILKQDADYNEARKDAYDELVKSLSEVDEEENEQIIEQTEDFNESQLESLDQHLESLFKTEDDYQRERVRRTQDLYSQLRDLEMSNDALGFLQAKEEADKEFARSEEDHQRGIAEMKKEFADTQAENAANHQQSLADLKLANAERRLEMATAYQEDQAARLTEHQESIAALQADIDTRLDAQITGYARSEAEAWNQLKFQEEREQARLELQERYAKEDREMQEAENKAAFEAEQQQLQDQQNVALDQLADYYEAMGMTREEAEAKALESIETANALIEGAQSDHGTNMAELQRNTNAEIEDMQAIFHANMVAEMQLMTNEMISVIKTSAQEAAVAVAEASKPGGVIGQLLETAGDTLSNPIGSLGQLAGDVSQGLGDIAGSIVGIDGVGTAMNYMISDLGNQIGAFFGGYYAKGGTPPVGKASLVGEEGPELFIPREAGEIIPAGITKSLLQAGFGGAYAEGTSGGLDLFGRLIGGLQATLGYASQLQSVGSGLMGEGLKGLHDMLSNAINTARQVPGMAIELYQNILGEVRGMGDRFLMGVDDLTGGALSQARDLADQAIKSVDEMTGGMLTSAQELTTSAINFVQEEIVPGVQQLIDDPIGAFSNFVSDAQNFIGQLLDGNLAGLQTVVETNVANFGSLVGTAVEGIGGFVGNLFSSIGSTFDGIFSGLGFAAGGRPPVGQASVVGERGTEMFLPDSSRMAATSNQANVDWVGGMPVASAPTPQQTYVERSPQSVPLVVSTGHYKAGPQDEPEYTGGEYDSIIKPGNKIADTQKKIEEIQKKFSNNLVNIQSKVGEYHSKIRKFDMDAVQERFKLVFEEHTKELTTRQEFAQKMAMEGKTRDQDALQREMAYHEEMIASGDKRYAGELTAYGENRDKLLEVLAQFGIDSEEAMDSGLMDIITQLTGMNDEQSKANQEYLKRRSKSESEHQEEREKAQASAQETETDSTDDYFGGRHKIMEEAYDDENIIAKGHFGGATTEQRTFYKNQLDKQKSQNSQMTDTLVKYSGDTLNRTRRFYGDQQTIIDQNMNTAKRSVQTTWELIRTNFSSGTGAMNNNMNTLTGSFSTTSTKMQQASTTVTNAGTLVGQMAAQVNQILLQIKQKQQQMSSSGSSYGGGRAGGGDVNALMTYMVGEEGPELFIPSQDGFIVSYAMLKKMLSGPSMDVIPKAYDQMMQQNPRNQQMPMGKMGTSISLRIDNFSLGSDISRSEIESQFREMEIAIVETIGEAVG